MSSTAPDFLPLYLVLALAASLAAAGAFLAVQVLVRGPLFGDGEQPPSGVFGVGQMAPTSFGAVVVDHVEKIGGLTARDLGGVTHGIPNLVAPDEAQVQVSVRLTNRRDRPVDYSPAVFRLGAGTSGQAIAAAGSSSRGGRLPPQASVEMTLTFVAPADDSRLWLEYRDPARAEPVLIDLGRNAPIREKTADGVSAEEADREHQHE
ncbi:MAG: hypothetical protein HY331_06090 [Chloroflexi bacterium]|nr:hypothetical protein [Chloroflexota bacterium]